MDLGSGGRCYIYTNLGGKLRFTHRLPDHDLVRRLNQGLGRGITRNLGSLVIKALLLFGAVRREGRRSLALALRLLRLGKRMSAG